MIKTHLIIILAWLATGAIMTCSTAPQPPAAVPLPEGKSGWKLILNDEFDGDSYNKDIWCPHADWVGNGSFNNGRECYHESQVRVSGGVCRLVAQPEAGATEHTCSYRSGELLSCRPDTNSATPYKFTFLYGYIEARIKIVDVPGFFGAFWMLPAKTDYNFEWEIDILEVLGHDHKTMHQTYHYKEGLPPGQARDKAWWVRGKPGINGTGPVQDFSDGFHTFGVDWQPDHLTFYIDGVASGTFPDPGKDNGSIPRTPGYIIIQHMVENDWVRATKQLLPSSGAEDSFDIDYVRVWQAVD